MNTTFRPASGSRGDLRAETGMALIVALLAMLLMMALGTALIMTTTTESRIVKNFRNNSEAMYIADAALERAMDDVLTVADWNTLLSGATTSAFIDGESIDSTRSLADGTQLKLREVLNRANCNKVATCSAADMDAVTGDRPWGANNPRWQLYAYGAANDMLPTGTINSPFYVVVLVGDDPSETDYNPALDGIVSCAGALPIADNSTPPNWSCNPGAGVLALRAESFGPFGSHSVIEMTIARTDTTELERGYTGQRGQDEQNRRARKAAVQSPGKTLSRTELTTSTGVIQ